MSRTDQERLVARLFCVGFDGLQVTPELRKLLQRGVSSVILFARNYQSPPQLADLCLEIKSQVDRPVMICVDQEGGRVQRFHEPFTRIPPMRELGQRNDPQYARRIGRILAKELRAVNIDMNLAPVLDVDSNPDNPVIGDRSFSSDPAVVAAMGCAMIDGLQTSGIAACGKHFPGHGDTAVDSHLDLPTLPHDLHRLEQVELLPFRTAIDAGVAAIMCAHIIFHAIDPTLPATMSHVVIGDLLRKRLQFKSVVCSDDLEMNAIAQHFGIEQAVISGAQAGIDLFFICRQYDLQHRAIDALIRAVQQGQLPDEAIIESNQRLNRLFDRFVRPGSQWTQRSLALLSG